MRTIRHLLLVAALATPALAHGDGAAEMAVIPAGSYAPVVRGRDEPETIRVAPFALDVRPVTNGEFLEFVRANPRWQRSHVTPLFAAIKQGYFAEEGLEVDTAPSAGGATGIPGLIAGSFDIVYGNVVSMLLAAQQGIDIRVVAPGTKIETVENDTSAMVVRADSGIATGKDLEGKTVGVNTRNNVIWLYARAWIKASGLPRVPIRKIARPAGFS